MRVVVLALCLVACRSHFDEYGDGGSGGSNGGSDDGGLPSPTAVRVKVQGHGVALVAGQPPCASQCDYDVGAIDITAWAGQAWQLATFSNECGSATTCTVQPGSLVTLTFVRAPVTANLAFISSTTAPRTGLSGLDATCASAASGAGLTGTFIAFASTSTIDARSRFPASRGWVGMDGLPLFDTMNDVNSGTRARSITFDEHGTPMSNAALTGSLSDGSKKTTETCADWTASTGQAACGESDLVSVYSIANVNTDCGNPVRVFCLQTDRNMPISLAHPAAPMGRYVFVTNTTWTVGGGIAAADAFCQAQAGAAPLAGTYRAMLATSTASAASHIGGIGGMWRRPDGVVVSFAGLDQDPLDAAILLDASGAVSSGNDVIVGALNLTDLGTATCGDWTDAAATARYDTFMLSTRPWPKGAVPPSCASPSRLFCAQIL